MCKQQDEVKGIFGGGDIHSQTSSVTSLTQPAGLQLPLVEEEEFSFAVVDGGFSI